MEATINDTNAAPTVAAADTGTAPTRPTRRAARSAAAPKAATPRGGAGRTALLVVLALAVGAAGGVFAMRQRYRAKDALVAVNGVVINQWDLYARLETEQGTDALRRMVGEQLQLQFAKSKGVAVTDEQVEKRIKELRSRPKFEEEMRARGLNEFSLREQVRSELVRNAVLAKGINPTDAEVKRFYAANADPKNPNALFYTLDSVSLAAIVTETEGMARQAARDIAAGVPFTTAAKTYGKDPKKGAGIGIAGMLRGRSEYRAVPGFESTVFAMKVGEQVGPVRLGGKWWVIRCLDRKPASTVPFAAVEKDCRGFLALQMGRAKNGKKVEEEFAKWRKEGRVVALAPRYESAVAGAKE